MLKFRPNSIAYQAANLLSVDLINEIYLFQS